MTLKSGKGRTDSASRVIRADAKTLYEAYIDPEKLVQWLPPEGMSGIIGKYEPYKGGAFQITLTYESDENYKGKTTENTDVIEGKFLELKPYSRIVQTGKFESLDPSFSGEIIETILFEEVDEGTRVTFMIENVPEGISKADHDEGLRSTLEHLAMFTEEDETT